MWQTMEVLKYNKIATSIFGICFLQFSQLKQTRRKVYCCKWVEITSKLYALSDKYNVYSKIVSMIDLHFNLFPGLNSETETGINQKLWR